MQGKNISQNNVLRLWEAILFFVTVASIVLDVCVANSEHDTSSHSYEYTLINEEDNSQFHWVSVGSSAIATEAAVTPAVGKSNEVLDQSNSKNLGHETFSTDSASLSASRNKSENATAKTVIVESNQNWGQEVTPMSNTWNLPAMSDNGTLSKNLDITAAASNFGLTAGLNKYGQTLEHDYVPVSVPEEGLKYAPVAETSLESFVGKLKARETVESDKAHENSTSVPGTITEQVATDVEVGSEVPVVPTSPKPTQNDQIAASNCLDAVARGYSGAFVCCSVKSGDFFDPGVWDCNRVPTLLDAVFVRHFVKFGNVKSETRVRAMWIIDSVDPSYTGNSGTLRSGSFPNDLCRDYAIAEKALGVTELRALTGAFRLLLKENSMATLPELCKSIIAPPYLYDNEFKTSFNRVLRIESIDMPISMSLAAAVASSTLDPQRNLSISNKNSSERTGTSPELQILQLGDDHFELSDEEYMEWTNIVEQLGDSVKRLLGTSENENDCRYSTKCHSDKYADIWGAQNTEAHPVIPWRLLQSIPRDSDMPNVSGPVTLRVEANSSLLFFTDASVILDGDIRNDGTFYIGESVLASCLERAKSQKGKSLCRIPSLDVAGSIVAMQPLNVMWFQFGRGSTPILSRFLYGQVQYGQNLPNSARSTLTFYGEIEANIIIPGFSLSFKRIGFPPYPAPPLKPQRTKFTVNNSTESSDIIIYTDIFDDDGFIDCCEGYYEEDVAEFVVTGANLVFNRYTDLQKQIGDISSYEIPEQLVIRAPNIALQETFFGIPPIIKFPDSILTNIEIPIKKAGINRDILYFQCFNMCLISNQSFSNQKPYRFVQVARNGAR